MAPLPAVVRVLRVAVTGTYYGAHWANIFHVRYSGTTPTNADLNAFCTAFAVQYDLFMLNDISDGVTVTLVTAVDLSSTSGAQGSATRSDPGDTAGDSLSANVAVCISWKIARRYRGGHPRTYLCGIPDSKTANVQALNGTAQTAYAADAASFLSNVNLITLGGSTVELGCVSYYDGGVLRSVPLFEPYTGVAVNTRLDSQRRRLGR